MCGIVACLGKIEEESKLTEKVKKALSLIGHRGPDDIGLFASELGILGHCRLSIVDPKGGHQPLLSDSKKVAWVHNGEIYNHTQLKKEFHIESLETHSDSAAIGPLVEKLGGEAFDLLDGVFATILIGEDEVYVARDPLGVKPLFYGRDEKGLYWFASEWKAIEEYCEKVEIFPPGYYFTFSEGFVRYYKPDYKEETPELCEKEFVCEALKTSLTSAVKKRLMADVPIAALLSGGLDSSLVAALAQKELKKEGKTLKTFSIGMDPMSDDLKAARLVAEHIGSDHHEVILTLEEGLEAISHMVWLLETYDVTTIRASTPMYIMSKVIHDHGVKVVLSGEGADEIFGGYLYFGHAPSAVEFHEECLRRVGLLHTADLLRADRSTMGASLEARVPFLDKAFLEVAMAIDPELKVIKDGRPEKWILRESFKDSGLLPDEILWRQKEQFSDGVGYSWVDQLKLVAEQSVSDTSFEQRKTLYSYNTPLSKEAFYYRQIFSHTFEARKSEHLICPWIPKWQDYDVDPSGRANKSHKATVVKSSGKEQLSLVGK